MVGLIVFCLWSLFCYSLGTVHLMSRKNPSCLRD